MAQYNEGRTKAFKSTNDLSTNQYFLVKLDPSNTQSVILAASATDQILGTLRVPPKSAGDNCTVDLCPGQGTTKVIAGAAFAKGALLTSDANGRAIATTTAGNLIVGVAIEAASALGDIIEMKMVMYKF